jgi:tetratricopeptide (TPR) repeat protein
VPLSKQRQNRGVEFVALLLAFVSPFTEAAAQTQGPPGLTRIGTKSARTYYGEVLSKDTQEIRMFDVRQGKEISIKIEEVEKIYENLQDKESVSAVSYVNCAAWRVGQVLGIRPPKGKVAKVDEDDLVVTLGAKHSIEPNQELAVIRVKGEVIDPDTGESLGKDSQQVGLLRVVEVAPAFCKARKEGGDNIKIEVGDAIEPLQGHRAVAVFPFVGSSPELSQASKSQASAFTSALLKQGVRVIERAALDKVLLELAIQQTKLYDPKVAQKVGKQVGASAILTGTVAPAARGSTEAQVRLIEVETGEVLLTATPKSFVSRKLMGGRTKAAERPQATPAPRDKGPAESAEDLWLQAKDRFASNDYSGAVRDATLAIGKDPKLPGPYQVRGYAYLKMRRFDDSIRDFTKAIQLDPKEVDPYIRRAISYAERKETTKAIADLSEAIRLEPENDEAHYLRGLMHSRLGDHRKAIADYDAAISKNQGVGFYYHERAMSYERVGETDKARADRKRAGELDPNLRGK